MYADFAASCGYPNLYDLYPLLCIIYLLIISFSCIFKLLPLGSGKYSLPLNYGTSDVIAGHRCSGHRVGDEFLRNSVNTIVTVTSQRLRLKASVCSSSSKSYNWIDSYRCGRRKAMAKKKKKKKKKSGNVTM